MSFSTEQVRAQLFAMGYDHVPDAAVALFASKLTEKAKHHQQAQQQPADHSQLDHSSDIASIDGSGRQSDSPSPRYVRSSPRSAVQIVRPPLPPSNRSLLIQRTRPRTPLTALHSTAVSASPRQPLRITDSQSTADSTQRPLRAEEHCETEDGYTATTDGDSRSDKENVSMLIDIQRGLAKVLAERGIASPLKPAPTLIPHTSAASPSASSYRTTASRPSSPLSTSFASSSHSSESLYSDVSSVVDGSAGVAPLAGARALQLREEERVRGVRRGYGQGGFKKADVVSRYQQYRAEWEQSSFLHRRQYGR